MKFLVTGANGDIGDSIGRILRELYPDAAVYGADASGVWPAQEVFHKVHVLPWASDPTYRTVLEKLCASIRADLIIPTSEPELLRMAHSADRAAELPLLMNRPDIIVTFLDKLTTAQWLFDRGFPALKTTPLAEAGEADLPLIVKPRRSWGSKALEIVRTPARLAIVKDECAGDFVAQTFVDVEDSEYTCPVLRVGGALRCLILRRNLQGGMTGWAQVEENAAIDSLLVSIAEALDLDGAINVQLRLTTEGPQIFEINPRLSGTVMMRHKLGFCDLVWAIEARRGKPPPEFAAPVGWRVFRMSREVVVPPC